MLKTDINFKGTNKRHMSRSGKSQCISFLDKTLPLKNYSFLRRITQCYNQGVVRCVDHPTT